MSSSSSSHAEDPLSSGMSQSELLFLNHVREMLRATVSRRIRFTAAMASLLADLRVLRSNDWEATAIVGPGAHSSVAASVTTACSAPCGELTPSERELAEDMEGLIDHSVKNGISFLSLASVLAHDTGALASHEWSLEQASADFFVPKSIGWANRNREQIGEVEEITG